MEYLLKVSALIVIFYFIYKVFLQRDTFFEANRIFLLSGLIGAFVIPFIIIPIYVEQPTTLALNFSFSDPVISEEKETLFSILDLPTIVYFIGVFFFSIRFIIQFASLSILIFKNKSIRQADFTFVKVTTNVSPFSFFNWIVYNPNQFNKTELNQIITHEKVHVRQYHSIDILLSQLSCIVLWFNPFIWLYNKDLKQNLEFLADNSVINSTKNKKDYQYTLLKTSLANHQLALCNNFYNSLIKKRIVMLHKSKSKKINQFKFALVIPLLGLFLMSFNTEDVYISKVPPSKEIKSTSEIDGIQTIEMILITKDFTDKDFDNIISELKKKGIIIKFKSIKRNSDGKITALEINVNSKNAHANYNISSDEVIKPIKISFENGGKNISIGNGYANHNDENSQIHVSGKDHNVLIVSNDDEPLPLYIVDEKEITKKEFDALDENNIESINVIKDKSAEVKYGDKGKNGVLKITTKKHIDKESVIGNKIFVSGYAGKIPLYILNEKEITKKEFDALDENNIESINVIKDKSAEVKYGDKGKNGVLEITTKE